MNNKDTGPHENGLVVALDVNGTIVDGDSLGSHTEQLHSISLTKPARRLIKELTNRISGGQNIQVVIFTLGVDWPGVVDEIEKVSGGVISFDCTSTTTTTSRRMYVGRASRADPPGVFVRELVDATDRETPFEHDGILYKGANPVWLDPGPQLSYDAYRERMEGGHAVVRGVFRSGNSAVAGRGDARLPPKLLVSSRPVVVFDDHPGDWEVVSPRFKVVKTYSPAHAQHGGGATDFCKELNKFCMMES